MNKSEVFQRLFNKEKTLDLEIKNVSINSREKKMIKADEFLEKIKQSKISVPAMFDISLN